MSFVATYDSPLGRIVATSADGVGLSSLRFAPGINAKHSDLPVFSDTFRLLDDYFSGKFPDELPPVAVNATAFQRKVWRELCNVRAGSTITYGELGRRVGCMSAQAVGNAVARNPILILVPCHRVVRCDGIGNYSAGQTLKSFLLNHEKESLPCLFSEV